MGFVDAVSIGFGDKIDGVLRLRLAVFFVILSLASASGDERYTEKCHGATSNEFACVVARGPLKIAIEYCRPQNDGKREEHELNRNDLSGIEAL